MHILCPNTISSMRAKHLFVLIHIRNKGVVCTIKTSLSLPGNIYFTDRSNAVLLFVDPFCYICFVFVMLSCLFIAALWSPAGKGQTSWLLCCDVFLGFCHFPMWCPGNRCGN